MTTHVPQYTPLNVASLKKTKQKTQKTKSTLYSCFFPCDARKGLVFSVKWGADVIK